VELSIPRNGEVLLALFDSRGRLLGAVLDGYMAAGSYRVDVKSIAGRPAALPAGVYFLALYRKGNRMPEMVGSCTAALFQK
jgi:hypothetical protein